MKVRHDVSSKSMTLVSEIKLRPKLVKLRPMLVKLGLILVKLRPNHVSSHVSSHVSTNVSNHVSTYLSDDVSSHVSTDVSNDVSDDVSCDDVSSNEVVMKRLKTEHAKLITSHTQSALQTIKNEVLTSHLPH
ncbi:hypothetical protein PFMALIP_05810 [Plasmodium falciparum MaliPS096_E11]|uniref:Uncharacterized protein n=1 Tax=Plasmodium falciparum MaliPS096_E11 TaxID=1036727 RepID=A0A024WHF2_PLAFA|nr:hypothetical protein PFMALIP_05810 [Plasmodium falciparum MaliPS096_E11]